MRRKLLLMMMVCVLILAGCQNGKEAESSQDTTNNATENTDAASGDDAQAVEDGSTQTATSDKYLYSDKLVDRSLIEGKMAVYFLRGDYATLDAEGNEEPTGEGTLIVAPDGTTMLIDFNNCMINGSYIASVLEDLGIEKLDYVVVTSPHIEHLGGYSIVMHCAEVGQIIMNQHEFTSNGTYNNFIAMAKENNIPITRVSEGHTFTLGANINVEVLNPVADFEGFKKSATQREGALLLKLTYNQSSFLIGGDISSDVEAQLLEKYGEKLQADVVKMNYMAGEDSNSKDWITALSAKIAVGECNLVASDTIIGRYALRTDLTLHTAIDGTCLVYTAGDGTYEVQVEKERVSDTYLNIGAEEGHVSVQ